MNPRMLIFSAAVLFAVASASPSLALCGDVCEVSLRPHVVSVPLPLEGWVFEDASAVTVTVIDPPRFGDWLGQVYTPRLSFWEVGGDRIRLLVEETVSGHQSMHTLVLKVASIVNGQSYGEGFEDGVLPALEPEWHVVVPAGASISSVDPIEGDYSLEIDPGLGSARIERADGNSGKNGIDQMSGAVVINAAPPTVALSSFGHTVMQLEDFVSIRLLHDEEQYWLQASLENVDCPIDPCVTPLQPIQPDRDYRILATIGVRGLLHPFLESSYSFDLTITDLTTGLPARHLIANLGSLQDRQAPAPTSKIGAFDTTGTPDAVLRMDSFEYQEGRLEKSPLTGLVEDFTSGLWSPDWLVAGTVGTVGAARQDVEYWAGAVELANVIPGAPEAKWIDLDPFRSGVVWAHFKLGTEQLGLGQWGVFRVLEGKKDSGESHLYVQVRANGALELQMRAQVRDGTSECQKTQWIDLPGDWTQVDMAWDAEGGWLQLWLNGQLAERLELVPGAYRLDEIGFGVGTLSIGQGSLPTGSRVLLDDLVLLYD